jgi:hypothetical protein
VIRKKEGTRYVSGSNTEPISHFNARRNLIARLFILGLSFVLPTARCEMFDFSTVKVPTVAEIRANPATPDVDAPVTICPNKDHIQAICALETYTPEQVFTPNKDFDPFTTSYSAAGRCKLWWWAEYARNFHYAPLSEWAEDVQDSLIEKVSQAQLYDSLGPAPRPPRVKLNENGPPQAACMPPAPNEEARLIDHLRRFNLRSIPQRTLDDLVSHCLAFQVATAAWMAIGTRVVDSYVIPIGDINLLIWARTHVGAMNLALGSINETSDAGLSVSDEIRYAAVGVCPVDQDPRVCVENYLSELPPGANYGVYGFKQGYDHWLDALPYRTDLDGFYMNRESSPKRIHLVIDKMGYLQFSRTLDSKNREPLQITLYDGQFALVSSEPYCDPLNPERQRLALVPLAMGDGLTDLQENLGAYTASDFPESSHRPVGMMQKGCGKPVSYSDWAAQTANALNHIAHHGVSIDVLYKTAAAERYRRRLKNEGLREVSNDLVYGKWRSTFTDTVLINEPDEKRGVRFVLDSDGNGHTEGREDASRVLYVDQVPATQVWYHYRSVPIWPNAKDNIRAHILVSHLKSFDSLYTTSAMARFNKVASQCASEADQKRVFMEATYALLNAAPLEAGNGPVAKVFIAALYENLFGKKIDAMSSMDKIDLDAWMMPQAEFIDKYLSMIMD